MSLKIMFDLIDMVKRLTHDDVRIKEYTFTLDGNGFMIELTNGCKYKFSIGNDAVCTCTMEAGKINIGSVSYA